MSRFLGREEMGCESPGKGHGVLDTFKERRWAMEKVNLDSESVCWANANTPWVVLVCLGARRDDLQRSGGKRRTFVIGYGQP